MSNKWEYITCILAWIITAMVVCVGLELTHSAWCLWAFAFPAYVQSSI